MLPTVAPRTLRIVSPLIVAWCAGSCGEFIRAESVVMRVEVAPVVLSLIVGRDTTVTARGELANGTFVDDARIFWSSADPTIASVDTRGRVTAIRPGNTRVAASSGGQSALVQVGVAAPPVASVRVSPPTSGITVGAGVTLRAAALLASGDTASGRPVSWRTNSPGIATVSASGIVQGLATGTASIIATVEGVSGSAVVSVTPVPVSSVLITPASGSVIITKTLQLAATTHAADGVVLIGRVVTWSSSVPNVASVSTAGLVTTLTTGATAITALSEGKRGTARIVVVPVPVQTVTVSPTDATLLVGRTIKLSAATLDSVGGGLPGRVIHWTTTSPGIATVDSVGLVTAIAPGSAKVRASSEGKSASAGVTVTLPPVVRVTVSPASVTIAKGGAIQLVATPLDAQGLPLPGRAISWLSGAPSLAKVDAKGIVTGLASGTVLIFATSEGQRGSATVTVR